MNLTAGFQHAFRHAAVDVFGGVENLLDEKYVSSVYINGVNGRFFEGGMERNYLVGVALRTN
jgi:outer membrane receptor protein involved in Fe transport